MKTAATQQVSNTLPADDNALVRLSQIIGDRKRGICPIVPISKSAWWEGVKQGRYPAPIKLSEKITCWRSGDIRALLQAAGGN